jgi:hypothetical protein
MARAPPGNDHAKFSSALFEYLRSMTLFAAATFHPLERFAVLSGDIEQ